MWGLTFYILGVLCALARYGNWDEKHYHRLDLTDWTAALLWPLELPILIFLRLSERS